MDELSIKYKKLISTLGKYVREGLVVAFSGGVDSAFLVAAAEDAKSKSGGTVIALTTTSESMPEQDKTDADKFISRLGTKHIWRDSFEINSEEYVRNDVLRCYYCKRELFKIAKEVALQNKCKWIAYGYSASDTTDTRPGHKAAIENNILFPLAEYNFSKSDIRELMRRKNIELSDKPSSPCISSRIMTNVKITKEKLKDIDELENVLRAGGLKVFRLRHHEIDSKKFLRLEAEPGEMALAYQLKDILIHAAKLRGYRWVTLDLEGYKQGGGTQ